VCGSGRWKGIQEEERDRVGCICQWEARAVKMGDKSSTRRGG